MVAASKGSEGARVMTLSAAARLSAGSRTSALSWSRARAAASGGAGSKMPGMGSGGTKRQKASPA
jgi:hypothetical protein